MDNEGLFEIFHCTQNRFWGTTLLIREMVVESWNRQHYDQTIYPTEKFNSMNLFKILWVVAWAWSFLTSEVMEAVRGQKKPLEAKKGLESKDFWGHQYQLLYSSNLTNDKITFGMASVPSVTLTWKPLYKSLMTETFYFQALAFRVLEPSPKVLISSEVKKFLQLTQKKISH